MSTKLVLAGFEEMKAQFRALTPELAEQAGPIVLAHAQAAAAAIVEAYPPGELGDLKNGVKVDQVQVSGVGAVARVRSTSKLAYIFENGTQARHTETGANRGAMPPGHVFVPIVVRERRAMNEDLIGLVQSEGLTVTGHE